MGHLCLTYIGSALSFIIYTKIIGNGPFPANAIYFRWGQNCALFRAAPIIAVEKRRRGFTHRGSCDFFSAIYTSVK